MRRLYLEISVAAMVLLAACGSDSGTGSESAVGEAGKVKTVYGLGECEASNEGVIKLVTSVNQYYMCVNGDWKETESSVQSCASENAPFAVNSSSAVSSFVGSSSSNTFFPDIDTKSSSSFGIVSTDSKGGYDSVKQTLTDSRDGQTYRTVKIGDQVWMAENLNYEAEKSYCYDDEESKCARYGRIYKWATATSACPSGWHLPSRAEWEKMIVIVDGSITKYADNNTAGATLKSASGWNSGGNGSDTYSFSALPAGYMFPDGICNWEGKDAVFWSSSECNVYTGCLYDGDYAFCMYLSYRLDAARLSSCNQVDGKYVRCLKD